MVLPLLIGAGIRHGARLLGRHLASRSKQKGRGRGSTARLKKHLKHAVIRQEIARVKAGGRISRKTFAALSV